MRFVGCHFGKIKEKTARTTNIYSNAKKSGKVNELGRRVSINLSIAQGVPVVSTTAEIDHGKSGGILRFGLMLKLYDRFFYLLD